MKDAANTAGFVGASLLATCMRREQARSHIAGPSVRKSEPTNTTTALHFKRPRAARAFTLIEVLVALAIVCTAGLMLAIAFSNVMKDYDAVFHRADHAGDLTLVRAALYATTDPALAQAWNDLALPEARHARWRAVITPGQLADLFVVECQVEISGTGEKDTFKATEHLMLLRPTWSQPADRETLRAASRDKLAQRKWD